MNKKQRSLLQVHKGLKKDKRPLHPYIRQKRIVCDNNFATRRESMDLFNSWRATYPTEPRYGQRRDQLDGITPELRRL